MCVIANNVCWHPKLSLLKSSDWTPSIKDTDTKEEKLSIQVWKDDLIVKTVAYFFAKLSLIEYSTS